MYAWVSMQLNPSYYASIVFNTFKDLHIMLKIIMLAYVIGLGLIASYNEVI